MGIYHIPRYLLPHSVTVKTELTHDEWGGCTYKSDALSNVRVACCETIKRGKNDREDSSDAVLYYDAQNSLPLNFAFEVGQIVELTPLEIADKALTLCEISESAAVTAE